MDSSPLSVQEFFVFNPDNTEFVSDLAYRRAMYRKLRLALISFLVIGATQLIYQFLRVDNHDLASLALSASLIAFAVTLWALYRAWKIGRLVRGQFLDATVVKSAVGRYHHVGKHSSGGQFLHVTYTFVTPTGKQLHDTLSIRRNDTFLEAPEPDTPLIVRYVNDHLFQLI